MKKKISAVFMAAILALSVFALSACGETKQAPGTIEGDYKQLSDEEMTSVVQVLNARKLFGDSQAADWQQGLSASIASAISVTQTTPFSNTTYALKNSARFTLTATPGAEGTDVPQIKGVGKYSGEFSGMKNLLSVDADKAEGTVYLDSDYVYADAKLFKGKEETQAKKIKTRYRSLIGSIGGILPTLLTFDSIGIAPDTILKDAETFKAALRAVGVVLEADLKDGIKIKVSATEDTFCLLASQIKTRMAGMIAEGDEITFDKTKCELYLAIDKEGAFSEAAICLDVAGSVTIGPMVVTFSMTDAENYKAYAGTVTLPEGLVSDPSYVEVNNGKPNGNEGGAQA